MRHSLDFAVAGMNPGNLYESQGDVETAEKYYRAALEIDDIFFPVNMNLAMLLGQQARNAEAEVASRKAMDLEPDRLGSAGALSKLAVVCRIACMPRIRYGLLSHAVAQ